VPPSVALLDLPKTSTVNVSVMTQRRLSRDQVTLENVNTTALLDVLSKTRSVAPPIHSKCTVNVNVTTHPKLPTPTTPSVNRNVPSPERNTPMAFAANPTSLATTVNAFAPLLVKSTMDPNVPPAPLVRTTTG